MRTCREIRNERKKPTVVKTTMKYVVITLPLLGSRLFISSKVNSEKC